MGAPLHPWDMPTVEFGEGLPALMPGLAGPFKGAYALAPSDQQDIGMGLCRSLYIGVAGDVTLDTETAQGILFKAVPVGVLPIRTRRVRATGTTALNIVALY